MQSIKFRNTEEIKHLKIPFELTEKSISDWLYDLLALEHSEAIRKLFYIIEALNKTEVPVQRKIVFLDKINDYIKLIVGRIGNISSDLAFPLEQDERNLIEMIVWCYLGQADSQNKIAEKISNKSSRIHAWYQALFSLSQAYLHMSAAYTLPCKGFWLMCYQIYSSAEEAKVLDIALTDSKLEGESIAKLFKQIIVFSLSDPNQFRATEMRTIFNYLGKFNSQIHIEQTPQKDRKKGVFIFDSMQDSEPLELASLSYFKQIKSTRYIETVALAKHIHETVQKDKIDKTELKSINKALFTRFIKTLGMLQTRKYTRVEDNRTTKGIVGYIYISSYLRSINRAIELEVEVVETEMEKQTNNMPTNFDLVPIGDEHAHQMRAVFKKEIEPNNLIKNIYKLSSESSSDEDFWDAAKTDSDVLIRNVKGSDFSLINSSAKGYGLCWNNMKDRAKLGGVLGISSADSERLEISIIRRIHQLEENTVFLGVEVVGFESVPVYITKEKDDQKGSWAIYLPGIKTLKQVDSIMFQTGAFGVGEKIIMQEDLNKQECRLVKLLNSTNSISQAEIVYEQNDEESE